MNDRVLDFSQGSRSNLRDVINKQLLIFLEAKNYEAAKTLLIPVASVDIAEAIADLPKTMQIIAFRLLNKQEAIEVYKYLDKATQQSLIEDFKDTEAVEIINNMSPDERVKLLDKLPPQLVRKFVAQLTPQEREFNALLLGYDAKTAGRIMTPEYIFVKENIFSKANSVSFRKKLCPTFSNSTYSAPGIFLARYLPASTGTIASCLQ